MGSELLHVSTRSARLSANSAEELRELASKVGQVAYGVHEYFGNGLLEKVYECALEHRLNKEGYNYLKITRNPVGLLINFCSYKFERRTITS